MASLVANRRAISSNVLASPAIESAMHRGLRCTRDLMHAGSIITANKLQAFYPPQAFQAVVQRLSSVDFRCRRN